MDKNIRERPKIIHTINGYFALCPNCEKHLASYYDEKRDKWLYEEKCIFCGQKILDDQK